MINIITSINNRKYIHAAIYNEDTGEIELNCDSLKYKTYYADIKDYIKPSKENVTCKKCLITIGNE
jgi:hypothetical protein